MRGRIRSRKVGTTLHPYTFCTLMQCSQKCGQNSQCQNKRCMLNRQLSCKNKNVHVTEMLPETPARSIVYIYTNAVLSIPTLPSAYTKNAQYNKSGMDTYSINQRYGKELRWQFFTCHTH